MTNMRQTQPLGLQSILLQVFVSLQVSDLGVVLQV